jgi:hypothetical protein
MGQPFVRRTVTVGAVALLASGAVSCAVLAQSANDRAAWNALILSPVGALAPLARDVADDDTDVPQPQNDVWLRYGRWRYDMDDAIHNNIGVTVFRAVPLGNSELSLTGAYLSLSCAMCPSWISGGASLQSRLWQHGASEEPSSSVGLRLDVGGAHYRGDSQTTAASATSAVVVAAGVPFIGRSHLSAAVSPGIGYGRIALVDGIHSGARRTLGAALAWTLASGVAFNLGMQKIVIAHAPTQIGLGVGWAHQ